MERGKLMELLTVLRPAASGSSDPEAALDSVLQQRLSVIAAHNEDSSLWEHLGAPQTPSSRSLASSPRDGNGSQRRIYSKEHQQRHISSPSPRGKRSAGPSPSTRTNISPQGSHLGSDRQPSPGGNGRASPATASGAAWPRRVQTPDGQAPLRASRTPSPTTVEAAIAATNSGPGDALAVAQLRVEMQRANAKHARQYQELSFSVQEQGWKLANELEQRRALEEEVSKWKLECEQLRRRQEEWEVEHARDNELQQSLMKQLGDLRKQQEQQAQENMDLRQELDGVKGQLQQLPASLSRSPAVPNTPLLEPRAQSRQPPAADVAVSGNQTRVSGALQPKHQARACEGGEAKNAPHSAKPPTAVAETTSLGSLREEISKLRTRLSSVAVDAAAAAASAAVANANANAAIAALDMQHAAPVGAGARASTTAQAAFAGATEGDALAPSVLAPAGAQQEATSSPSTLLRARKQTFPAVRRYSDADITLAASTSQLLKRFDAQLEEQRTSRSEELVQLQQHHERAMADIKAQHQDQEQQFRRHVDAHATSLSEEAALLRQQQEERVALLADEHAKSKALHAQHREQFEGDLTEYRTVVQNQIDASKLEFAEQCQRVLDDNDRLRQAMKSQLGEAVSGVYIVRQVVSDLDTRVQRNIQQRADAWAEQLKHVDGRLTDLAQATHARQVPSLSEADLDKRVSEADQRLQGTLREMAGDWRQELHALYTKLRDLTASGASKQRVDAVDQQLGAARSDLAAIQVRVAAIEQTGQALLARAGPASGDNGDWSCDEVSVASDADDLPPPAATPTDDWGTITDEAVLSSDEEDPAGMGGVAGRAAATPAIEEEAAAAAATPTPAVPTTPSSTHRCPPDPPSGSPSMPQAPVAPERSDRSPPADRPTPPTVDVERRGG